MFINEKLLIQIGCKAGIPSGFISVLQSKIDCINKHVTFWILDDRTNEVRQVKIKTK